MKIIILLFWCVGIYAQSEKINFIELEYDHTMQPASYTTKIIIESPYDKSSPITIKTTTKGKTVKEILSLEDFNKICFEILELSPRELVSNFNEGGDGATTTLRFGDLLNAISYKAWGLNNEDLTYASPELLRVVQMICNLAKIKIRDLN